MVDSVNAVDGLDSVSGQSRWDEAWQQALKHQSETAVGDATSSHNKHKKDDKALEQASNG